MRNAEEHKKLLAQIEELEKNSVNYFDVEKEFFLIDSNNLAEVKTRFYGYSIQATGIYEEDNLTEDAAANLDGRGCYVYVAAKDGKITIKQDLNGCWGIYLFRHGNYFALSNSFFRLLDHVKYRYSLTVNRDYCHYVMADMVAVQAYSQTAVNEINLIDRSAILQIDIAKKNLEIELIDYREHSIPVDSEEGIKVLDNWVEFWSKILSHIAQNTNFIQADLTGGFDTRIHFVPLLHSSIDLNRIRINSSTDKSSAIAVEDYAIASQIAEHYGFKLNKPLPARQFLNFSLADAWNSDSYQQQTVRNLPTAFFARKGVEKLYLLKGLSGEFLRKTWHMPPQKFIRKERSMADRYSPALAQDVARSIQTIVESVFRSVCAKYKINDLDSEDIPQYLYHETRTRNHCGKEIVGHYLKNAITIIPSHDPEIQTLKIKSAQFPDYNFLMVLLFTRYAPDLLKIRFDKFHEAPDIENLVPYAQKINERFPRRFLSDKDNGGVPFNLQPRDLQAEKILAEGKNNPSLPSGFLENCLKATFESSKTFGLFTTYFDEELYRYAADYYDTHVFGRYRPMYSVVGVTKALEDVEISQRNQPLYRDMQRFLEQDFARISADDNAEIVRKFKGYFTARIDVNLLPTTQGELQILSMSDRKATSFKASWLPQSQSGYFIHSYAGNLEIVAKPSTDGQLFLYLRGTDTRKPDDKSKRLPCWIDYTKLLVNEKVIFDELTPTWHDKPFIHKIDVKADEAIKIEVEWLPHRSDT